MDRKNEEQKLDQNPVNSVDEPEEDLNESLDEIDDAEETPAAVTEDNDLNATDDEFNAELDLDDSSFDFDEDEEGYAADQNNSAAAKSANSSVSKNSPGSASSILHNKDLMLKIATGTVVLLVVAYLAFAKGYKVEAPTTEAPATTKPEIKAAAPISAEKLNQAKQTIDKVSVAEDAKTKVMGTNHEETTAGPATTALPADPLNDKKASAEPAAMPATAIPATLPNNAPVATAPEVEKPLSNAETTHPVATVSAIEAIPAKVAVNNNESWKETEKQLFAGLSEDSQTQTAMTNVDHVLEKIDNSNKEHEVRISKIEKLVRNLNSQIVQNKKKIDAINRDTNMTTKLLQDLIKEVRANSNTASNQGMPNNNMNGNISNNTQPKAQAISKEAPTLAVYAVIPGRAWLRNKSGDVITVTEGDMLDPYGKVLAIDAQEGIVLTSSGVALR